ncbi:MAG: hypothetical protein QXW80_00395 [Candidatus Micrarchaeia archaeon]
MQPKVRFEISVQEDMKTAYNFLGYKSAGVNFSRNITKMLPALDGIDKTSDTGKKLIRKEVNDYYRNHEKELRDKLSQVQKRWSKIEDDFLDEVSRIFKGKQWPEGKYICYISIFNCNPRNLGDKTFQMWMNKSDDEFLGGIAHEMLHFMFYDYAGGLGFTQKQMWNLSEVINTILLNLPQFKRLFPNHAEKGYPAHSALIERWKKLWTGDIDSFLKMALENKVDFEL